eukprot:1160730-Pelagomonas_calceolata.AAC.8
MGGHGDRMSAHAERLLGLGVWALSYQNAYSELMPWLTCPGNALDLPARASPPRAFQHVHHGPGYHSTIEA